MSLFNIHSLNYVNSLLLNHPSIQQLTFILQNLQKSINIKKSFFIQNDHFIDHLCQLNQLISKLHEIKIDFPINRTLTPQFPSQSIYFNHFYRNSANFLIAFIFIPKGTEIPLHDHKNMTVLTKLLAGQLEIQSMDIDQQYIKITKFMRSELQHRRKNLFYRKKKQNIQIQQFSGSINSKCSKKQFEIYEAQFYDKCKKLKEFQYFSNPNYFRVKNFKKTTLNCDNSQILTPTKGNIHRLVAKSDCIVIDILLSDYRQESDCNYYEYESNFKQNNGLIYKIKSTKQKNLMKDLRDYR